MDKLLIAFNKVDLLAGDPQKKGKQLTMLKAQIARSKFGPTTKIVPVSAAVGADQTAGF